VQESIALNFFRSPENGVNSRIAILWLENCTIIDGTVISPFLCRKYRNFFQLVGATEICIVQNKTLFPLISILSTIYNMSIVFATFSAA